MLELTGQMAVKMKIRMKTIKKENKQDNEENKLQTRKNVTLFGPFFLKTGAPYPVSEGDP